MKSFNETCITILALLSVLSSSLAAPIRIRQSVEDTTDTLFFIDTIDKFEEARNARDPPDLDWSSDNCSDSPDNPLGFDFVPSCQRHDFGYRNYKAQNRFTDENKDMIDSNFKNDLDNQCDTYSEVDKIACLGVAELYYEAVHEIGNKKRAKTAIAI